MLTIIQPNPGRIEGGVLTIDRKFHLGMQNYVREISVPILSIHPSMSPDFKIMDPVHVPLHELGYDVLTLDADRRGKLGPDDQSTLERKIAESQLIYGGGFDAARIAHRLRVPYILTMEYDLKTQIVVAASRVKNPVRRAVRAVRCGFSYTRHNIVDVIHAHSVHCNGYPIYDESRWLHSKRLLYLDSRMTAEMVIAEAAVRDRLASRPRRALRLLYSGRYEPLKGSLDAVRVAIECLQRGLDVEMHCYGQGSLRDAMRQLVAKTSYGERVHVHDAVPYPELVELSRTFDIFVCCHIQNDPSCTYLESFGAGLPIVGYANRMWRRLCEESAGGYSCKIGNCREMADRIGDLDSSPSRLSDMSFRAREFALAHSFENEFKRRTDALNEALTELKHPRAPYGQ